MVARNTTPLLAALCACTPAPDAIRRVRLGDFEVRLADGGLAIARADGTVLADEELDAVMIATGDHQHAKLLVEVVRAGKDCYCEKPMANRLEEAMEAVASSGYFLFLDYRFRQRWNVGAIVESVELAELPSRITVYIDGTRLAAAARR